MKMTKTKTTQMWLGITLIVVPLIVLAITYFIGGNSRTAQIIRDNSPIGIMLRGSPILGLVVLVLIPIEMLGLYVSVSLFTFIMTWLIRIFYGIVTIPIVYCIAGNKPLSEAMTLMSKAFVVINGAINWLIGRF